MHVLAIDQGTSSTKALVVADDGAVLAQAEVPLSPRALDDGGVEQDPEALWQSVLGAGRQAVAQARVSIGAVGLANQGETVLVWERTTGRPLSAAISWQDRRATAVCDRLRADAERLQAITGLPLDPYFAAPKMRWLRDTTTTSGVCTTTDSWLLFRLCGAFVTDAATASRTLLLDLDAVEWSADACAAFGLDPQTLPAVVGCATPLGDTDAFGAAAPICGAAVDQQAALFAEGCHGAGEAKCTYGTGAFLLATLGPRASRSRAGLATCVAWRLGERTTYCLDGQVYTVGAAVTWLTRLGFIQHAADLDRLSGAAADAGGAIFVPALAGLAAPFWRPQARATFAGLGLATSREQLVRAVIDGIAAQIAWLARAAAADLGTPLTTLRADGGLTRSRALMQAQADLLQTPVEVYPSPHATALGVGALARLGAGAASNPAVAIGSWRPSARYEPRISADEAEIRLQRWRRAADAALDVP